jgi:alkanesulfonate monooxygenase SsuD/methylene tetrahydromethanopterin reductase-like flavin-dependent oxidoreductase (luciferase family)
MYVPQPLTIANWILESTSCIWSGAAPMLLTLADPRVIAEQVAWMSARFPGRVGLGVAPGNRATDFELLGRSFEARFKHFRSQLEIFAECRGANGLMGRDWAIGEGYLERVPVVVTAQSRPAIDRATRLGFGLALGGDLDTVKDLVSYYRGSGEGGPLWWMRRFWVGTPLPEVVEALDSVYITAGTRHSGNVAAIHTGSPETVADRIADEMIQCSLTCINLRPHLPGVPREEISEQIQAFGENVMPRLRKLLADGH